MLAFRGAFKTISRQACRGTVMPNAMSPIRTMQQPSTLPSLAIRAFSASSEPPVPPTAPTANPDLNIVPPVPEVDISAVSDAVLAAGPHPELGYRPTELIMQLIENTHQYLGIPYWETIALLCVCLRICLLPVGIKGVINGARMAHLKPHMARVQAAMQAEVNKSNPDIQRKYQHEMQSLFKIHKVNPFQAMLMPLFQIPIFISVFIALREIGDYFPGMKTGGTLWFTDLCAADPTYIFPVINALSFLAMIEMGSDGMALEDRTTFKNVMRVMAVAMVPLTSSMPASVFVYWTTNNSFSLVQTALLKAKGFRKMLDIPDPPAANDPNANLKIGNPLASITKSIKNEFRPDQTPVIVDGSRPQVAPGPPPVTFSAHPRNVKKATTTKDE